MSTSKRFMLVGLIAGLLVGGPASGLAAELKIGVVDAAKLMDASPQAEAARAKLEREFAPRNDTLVAEQKALKQMEDRLARDGAVMSDSQQRDLERDILSARRELKRTQDEFREDLNIRRNEELARLQKEISETIRELAREMDFDVILSNANVVYASKRIDITEPVLKRLQRR